MSGPYIDQDTLDQCREAMRRGVTAEQLAGKLSITDEHFARVMGLRPSPEPVPAESDLWAADQAHDVL